LIAHWPITLPFITCPTVVGRLNYVDLRCVTIRLMALLRLCVVIPRCCWFIVLFVVIPPFVTVIGCWWATRCSTDVGPGDDIHGGLPFPDDLYWLILIDAGVPYICCSTVTVGVTVIPLIAGDWPVCYVVGGTPLMGGTHCRFIAFRWPIRCSLRYLPVVITGDGVVADLCVVIGWPPLWVVVFLIVVDLFVNSSCIPNWKRLHLPHSHVVVGVCSFGTCWRYWWHFRYCQFTICWPDLTLLLLSPFDYPIVDWRPVTLLVFVDDTLLPPRCCIYWCVPLFPNDLIRFVDYIVTDCYPCLDHCCYSI